MKTRIASAWTLFQACEKGVAALDGSGDPERIVREHGHLRTAIWGFWTSRRTFCQQRGRISRVARSGHGKANGPVSRVPTIIEANLALFMQPVVGEISTVTGN